MSNKSTVDDFFIKINKRTGMFIRDIREFLNFLILGGTDPLPLPVAKNVIYVDCNNDQRLEIGLTKEYFLESLIKKMHQIYQATKIHEEWTSIGKRPIAKVHFTWGDMPNLTKNGDTTQLIYLFR